MSDTGKCPNCGARARRRDERFCAWCGTELRPPEVPAPAPGPHGDLAARFDALDRHPDLPELLRRSPSAGLLVAGFGCTAAFGLAFAVLALFMFGAFQGAGGPTLFGLFPLLFVAVGVGLAIHSLVRAGRLGSAPLERVHALVCDERTEVQGGGDRGARTRYFVTLEDRAGLRRELRASGGVAGRVARGDVGVAYVRDRHLIDFARVRV